MSEEDSTIVEKRDVGDSRPGRCNTCGMPQPPEWLDPELLQFDFPATREEFEELSRWKEFDPEQFEKLHPPRAKGVSQ